MSENLIVLDEEPGNEKALVSADKYNQSTIGGINVNALLEKAIDKETPVETMEKLLAMARQLKADYALEQFNISLSEFQAVCPEIEKTKIVKGKDGEIRYKYASLEIIVRQVKDLIRDHGFSYTIKTEQTESNFTAICEVRHIYGHSEKTAFVIPIDVKAYMGAAQKVGAASTYAKRYAFCNAFGIMTGDEDIDANDIDDKESNYKQYPKGNRLLKMTVDEAKAGILSLIEEDKKVDKILEADYCDKMIKRINGTSTPKGGWVKTYKELDEFISSKKVAF